MRVLGMLIRPVTYTRGMHLALPLAIVALMLFVFVDRPYIAALLVVPVGLVPAMRLAESVQAQLFLTPQERGLPDATIAVASSASWQDRLRTVLWLEARLALSAALLAVGVPMIRLCADLVRAAAGYQPDRDAFIHIEHGHWWYGPIALVPIAIGLFAIVGLGEVVTALARLLLGPSPTERMKVLEARTERLLEHNRIARELHDSIGHALTMAVLQAGAARTADDPKFTARALGEIEDTGRTALEDLERVLALLREPGQSVGSRPTLADVPRLCDSARSAGIDVDLRFTGSVDRVPSSISRESYRMLQEALTNVLRHAGDTRDPVRLDVAIGADGLRITVLNNIESGAVSRRGSGLRGIHERAELLGGTARTGQRHGRWQVQVELPFECSQVRS